MIAESGTLSYRELHERIARTARLFEELGLRAGDRIVLASSQDIALASIFMAALRCGLTTVLLNPEARPAELSALVGAADPRALFLDEGIDLPADAGSGLPVVRVRADAGATVGSLMPRFGFRKRRRDAMDLIYPEMLVDLEPVAALPESISPDQTAYILFTSGTTSRPKGVEISHRALFAQMDTFIRVYGLDASTRLFNLLPFHHTDGLTHGLVVTLCANATLLRPMRIRVNRIDAMLEAIYTRNATHVITVPSVLALMLDLGDQYRQSFKAEGFRFVISTAAYLDEGIWREFEKRFSTQVINVYGLTETVCESLYCGPDPALRRIGTVGKPVDAEARIVDQDGRDVATGETGELLLRGEHLMTGYFRMPEETARVLEQGWFATGDLASRDEDGFYRIVGRKKDVIISAGINVYPEDVNGVLRSMPGVVDAVTFGEPDRVWGERVVSCLILGSGHAATEADVAAYFLAHASPEKLPREIHCFEDFPRGPAGKVVTAELRQWVARRRLESTGTSGGGGATVERVLRAAAQAFMCEAASLTVESTQETVSSWTSLAHVEFLLNLELEFKITLTPKDIMRIKRIGDAVAIVDDSARTGGGADATQGSAAR
jgi:long-chain acyl-CoA synthetase